MQYVTLDDLKAHLRITTADDDALLTTYANAAEAHVLSLIRTVNENVVRAAVLLLVGDLYENREAQTEKALSGNATLDRLLWPLRDTI